MYVSDKSQEECLLDHRKFPVQEEILGLPVERSIVGLLAEVPLPQLQLTRGGWKIVGTAFCSHIAQKSLNQALKNPQHKQMVNQSGFADCYSQNQKQGK